MPHKYSRLPQETSKSLKIASVQYFALSKDDSLLAVIVKKKGYFSTELKLKIYRNIDDATWEEQLDYVLPTVNPILGIAFFDEETICILGSKAIIIYKLNESIAKRYSCFSLSANKWTVKKTREINLISNVNLSDSIDFRIQSWPVCSKDKINFVVIKDKDVLLTASISNSENTLVLSEVGLDNTFLHNVGARTYSIKSSTLYSMKQGYYIPLLTLDSSFTSIKRFSCFYQEPPLLFQQNYSRKSWLAFNQQDNNHLLFNYQPGKGLTNIKSIDLRGFEKVDVSTAGKYLVCTQADLTLVVHELPKD